MFLTPKLTAGTPRHGAIALIVAAFLTGLSLGALAASRLPAREVAAAPAPSPVVVPSMLRAGHPARVLRVIDGDTFEARINVWPGMEITTKVRLRGIDAPEINARCADEYRRAVIARDALTKMLAEGDVGIWRVGQDKYGGRVDAEVSTRGTRDVSTQLLAAGAVRRYDGGRRQSWCE
ncbi:MAG: thermonuclease family protein [Pseudolabrys sp.]